MEIFWVFLVVVLIVVVGNLLILLRTAKKPKVPDSARSKTKGYDDEGEGW